MQRGFLNNRKAKPKTSRPSNDAKLEQNVTVNPPQTEQSAAPSDLPIPRASAKLQGAFANRDAFAEGIRNTNRNPNLADSFDPEMGTIVAHHFTIGDFEVSTALDSRVLAVLPKPFTPLPPNRKDTFMISSTENTGLGMFASRNIATGELIIAEHPVIILLANRTCAGMTQTDFCRILFRRLNPPFSQQLYTLYNCKSPEECGVEEGILRTNGIGIELPIPPGLHKQFATHSSVFLHISRCNHSCGPNVTCRWDLATFSMSLFASRSIAAGEEITLSYVETTEPRHSRHAKLSKMYNIDCKCKYCDLPDAKAISNSDQTRMQIPSLYTTIIANGSLSLDGRIKAHMQAMRKIKQEGILRFEEPHCSALASCHYQRGDIQMFRLWGKRAMDAHKAENNPEIIKLWETWMGDPSSFNPHVV